MSTQSIDTPGPQVMAEAPVTVFVPVGTPDDALLTIDEVAEYLRVPVESMRKWRLVGKGPKARMVGRSLRYRYGDVRAWLDEKPLT